MGEIIDVLKRYVDAVDWGNYAQINRAHSELIDAAEALRDPVEEFNRLYEGQTISRAWLKFVNDGLYQRLGYWDLRILIPLRPQNYDPILEFEIYYSDKDVDEDWLKKHERNLWSKLTVMDVLDSLLAKDNSEE